VLGIITDLFPGVVLPKADYSNMETAMTARLYTHPLSALT